MALEGLGRLFNTVQPASAVYLSLRDCAGITFEGFEVDGATSVTITFSSDAAGSATTTPDVVDHYHQRSSDQNNGVWVKVTQVASETFTPSNTTGDHWAVFISADSAPDGYNYVKATADGGTVNAIMHDLEVQRKPTNLVSPLV
jgi:hypothetical protein